METQSAKRKFHPTFLLIILYLAAGLIVITYGLIQIEMIFDIIPPDIVYIGQGVIFFLVVLIFSCSPAGEAMSRKRAKCTEISDQQLRAKVDALYNQAFAKAKELNPKLRDDIKIFINNEKSPNAVAVGNKSICITSGLLKRADNEIIAVLIHELAHISYKDTLIKAIIGGGDMGVRFFLFLFRIMITVVFAPIVLILCVVTPSKGDTKAKPTNFITVKRFGNRISATSRIGYKTEDVSDAVGNTVLRGGIGVILKLICKVRDIIANLPAVVWSAITILFVQSAQRDMEYDADMFTFNAGSGDGLCKFLHYIQVTYYNKKQSFMDKLSSSHPDPESRVSRLQQMGAKY